MIGGQGDLRMTAAPGVRELKNRAFILQEGISETQKAI
jgi:hypothetical protein